MATLIRTRTLPRHAISIACQQGGIEHGQLREKLFIGQRQWKEAPNMQMTHAPSETHSTFTMEQEEPYGPFTREEEVDVWQNLEEGIVRSSRESQMQTCY